jgi:antitoxin PrlF
MLLYLPRITFLYELIITMESLSSKVSMKYQVTLPKQVRDIINVNAGDRVVFIKEGSKVLLMRLDDLMDDVLDSFNDLEDTEKDFRNGFKIRDEDTRIVESGRSDKKESLKKSH